MTPRLSPLRRTRALSDIPTIRHLTMPSLYPSLDTIQQAFPGTLSRPQASPKARGGATPYQARTDLYLAYSVVDDAKNKAQKLSAEAAKEFEAASQKAQASAGKIELYSGKYYAACTFGGLLACVGFQLHPLDCAPGC